MRPILRRGCQLAVAGVVLGPPLPTRAAPTGDAPAEPLHLAWDGADDCPDPARVRAAVEAYLGRPTETRPDATTRVDVHVSRPEPEHWVARLTIETASGTATRSLDAGRCNVLADATALIVALAIDPTVAGRQVDTGLVNEPAPGEQTGDDGGPPTGEDPDPPPPEPEPPPEKEAEAPADGTSPPRPRRIRRPTRVALRLAGALGVPHLGAIAGGVMGAVGVLRPRLRVEAHGGHWFGRPIRNRGDEIGQTRLSIGGVRVCPRLHPGAVELDVCAGGELGGMFARAGRVDEPGEDRLLWAAFTVGPALMYAPVRYLAVGLLPELVLPVSRPRFLVEGRGEVLQAPSVAFQAQLGVEARFP